MDRGTIERVLRAAESAAAEIGRQAEEDARRMREQAERDAERIRGEARESAREHLAAMIQVTARLVEQLGSLDAGAPPSGRVAQPSQSSPAGAQPATAPAPEAPPAQSPPAAAPEQGAGGPGSGEDLDGARLIALNMALNGESRADTERYLAEHFTLEDRAKLVDEVYAAVQG